MSVANNADNPTEGSAPIPPSLFMLGNIDITGLDTTKTYGLTLDVVFRGIDDTYLQDNLLLWTGQYATTYGVRYTDTQMTELLNELTNVPRVVNPSQNTIANWKTAMTTPMVNIGETVTMKSDLLPLQWIGGVPGSWFTNQSSFDGPLAMNYNQIVYSLLYSVVNPTDSSTSPTSAQITLLVKDIMPEDGINYIVFKSS